MKMVNLCFAAFFRLKDCQQKLDRIQCFPKDSMDSQIHQEIKKKYKVHLANEMKKNKFANDIKKSMRINPL